MTFLSYLTSLSGSETKSGVGRKVKIATSKAWGASAIYATPKQVVSYSQGQLVGTVRETTTVLDKKSSKYVVYTAVDLIDPLLVDPKKKSYITYLWFKPSDLAFDDSVDYASFVPVYATSNVKIRPEPNLLKPEIRIVPKGELVGYTDKTSQKYLTYTFLKVFSASGKFVGWVASDYVSFSKKVESKPITVGKDGYSNSQEYDTSKDNSQTPKSGINILKVIGYGIAFVVVGLIAFKIRQNGRKQR